MIKASDIVVTAHQLNFLPGRSVMERIRRADMVIWLDGAQYVRHSFVNRNRFSDGAWMTVPVNDADTFAPINRVRIADDTGRAREKIARTLEARLGRLAAPFATELRRPYLLLAGLNHALLGHMFQALGIQASEWAQTFLDPYPPAPVVTEDEEEVAAVRERYAMMAAQLGATVWLSGAGKHHGDLATFSEHGIRLEYLEWPHANPCALETLALKAAA